MATKDGSWTYRDRFTDDAGRAYFRRFGDLVVSSIGLGTYLGDPTDADDDAYRDAIATALDSGCNVLDTAINYRCQRSERVVGEAIADAGPDREAAFVATKGGFVPFDGERPTDPGTYVREEYVDSGLADPDDLVRGMHCIAPDYIDDQFGRSLENLGVETIDCYYVHNPETQLETRPRETVYDQLEATFRRLEERVDAGELRYYGVATWEAFRVPEDHPSYLSLPEVVSRARAAADAADASGTRFRAVQLPFSVGMTDAFTVASQPGPDGPQSTLEFAHEAGLDVVTSASLAQGQLAKSGAVPDAVSGRLPGDTPAQRALTFARSAPGVTCSLVGMRSTAHVEENLRAKRFDAMGADTFDAIGR